MRVSSSSAQLLQNPLQALADGGLRDAMPPREFRLRRMKEEKREDEVAFFVCQAVDGAAQSLDRVLSLGNRIRQLLGFCRQDAALQDPPRCSPQKRESAPFVPFPSGSASCGRCGSAPGMQARPLPKVFPEPKCICDFSHQSPRFLLSFRKIPHSLAQCTFLSPAETPFSVCNS